MEIMLKMQCASYFGIQLFTIYKNIPTPQYPSKRKPCLVQKLAS